ncbi:glycosyltransferase family 2 protein [Candidatus Nitrosopelagicus sp.]|nr:glycosyltransferase family 2 protein [Candidatus Nitrosopelagicus sp.]
MNITVGIPAYNEEKNIAGIIIKLKDIADTIIVCNDGSSDSTSEIAKKLGAIVIDHPKNLGYGAGINSILKKSRELNSDILVTFDADGQHRIEDIKKVSEPIKQNIADIVIGSRFLDEAKEKIPNYRKLGINIITKVTNSTLKEKITDSQSGFRAYSKNVISKLNISDIGMGISTEILIKSSSLNFKIIEVPIVVNYDGNTSTHNPVSHGTSVLFSTIKYTSIEHPLKFYGIPSLIFFIIGFSFTYLSVQYYTEIGRINPNLTIIAAGTVLLAVVLLIAAILLYSLVSVVRENNQK